MSGSAMLNESSLKEFYQHVYPVDLITQWLSYAPEQPNAARGGRQAKQGQEELNEQHDEKGAADGDDARDSSAGRNSGNASAEYSKKAIAAESYLARREFCFTLMGDIFTRFRSYGSAKELREELVARFPEKIDVGGIYNVRPNQKQNAANVIPVERELIFDIDMSDYDAVRSCCEGRRICEHCWLWMSCAANVLRSVLEDDFGFKYILPVFSGRRGIHLWVCDSRARKMHDDERAALVGYVSVVAPKTMGSVIGAIVNSRPVHPTVGHLLKHFISPAFASLFVNSDPATNPNSVGAPGGAKVVYDAIISALKQGGRADVLQKFLHSIPYASGNVLDWPVVYKALGKNADGIIAGAQLLIMYPRLDEHVSTRRDHLLKLPFCVHPGTGSLCCPLEWDDIPTFNPLRDPPKLEEMLLTRHMDMKWQAPLRRMLVSMSADADEAQE